MTTFEGGMVTTNDRVLWSKMWSYKDHGKSWEAVYEQDHPPGFRWLHDSFGTNWRMTEMQAAIGRIQLRRMADWVEKRQLNVKDIFSTTYDPLMVKVSATETIDPDGFINYFKRYYYYKDDPIRILETKITP